MPGCGSTRTGAPELIGYDSLPVGVVTLAERFGQAGFEPDGFEAMVDDVAARLASFEAVHCIRREIREGGVQLLGTSGTVTTLAGVALGLSRYRRPLVDGTVLTAEAADEALADLRALGRAGLEAHPCVGPGSGGLRAARLRGVRSIGAAVAGAAGDRGRSRPARGHAAAHDPRRPEARPRVKGRKSPAPRGLAVTVRTAKSRSAASQRWLTRQLNDPYVAAAKQQGFRSRAAFKLVELDERFRLIRRGSLVVDLGAAPGGWTQVGGAARRGAGGGGGPAGGRSGGGRGHAARATSPSPRCSSG